MRKPCFSWPLVLSSIGGPSFHSDSSIRSLAALAVSAAPPFIQHSAFSIPEEGGPGFHGTGPWALFGNLGK